jgi:hypothetical protein
MPPFAVQLTGSSVRRGGDDTIAAAKDAFARRSLIRLPAFVDQSLLATLQCIVASAAFTQRVHRDLSPPAIDYAITDAKTRGLLTFMLNSPALFSVIAELTGAAGIAFFNPVIAKMIPGHGVDTWHDDADDNRLVALSVNLGARPYEGGMLMVRRKGEQAPIEQLQNVLAGDALLFRIDHGLEHYVTAVTGSEPRVSLVGWFQRLPDYRTLLAQSR